MSVEVPDPTELLFHPKVVAVMRAILVEFKWPEQDWEDGIQEVRANVIANGQTRPLPDTVDGMKALVREATYNHCRDTARSARRRRKYNDGATDAADDAAAPVPSKNLDSNDARKIRENADGAARANVGGKHTGAVLVDMMEGRTDAEGAERLGVAKGYYSKVKSKVRAAVKEHYVLAGITTAVAAAAVIAFILAGVLHGGQPRDANRLPGTTTGSPVPTTPPSAPAPPPEAVASADAAKLRVKAHAECDDEHWVACQQSLAEAARLDPGGAQARDVRRLLDKIQRERAEEGRHAKPAEPLPRSLSPGRAADLRKMLKPYAGQRIDLLCEAKAEPLALCAQLVSVFKGAGWVVSKTNAPGGTIAFHGMHLEVATGADDATEDAADVLAKGVDDDIWAYVEGPDDMALDAGAAEAAPLRLTVGPQ